MLSTIRASVAFVQQPSIAGRLHPSAARRIRQATTSILSQVQRETLVELEEGKYYEAEQVIKKSRFIGIAKYCTSWDSAQSFIQEIRDEHPKARHVCFGFVGGHNPATERASDDGEPTGTAGPPILHGINGEELSDTVCIVVRYSGGIKLGAGGLIRAYGGTARLALRASERKILIPKSTTRISTHSANSGQIYSTASKYQGIVEGESYNDKGHLEVTITCDTEKFDAMLEEIKDATRGDLTFV